MTKIALVLIVCLFSNCKQSNITDVKSAKNIQFTELKIDMDCKYIKIIF